MDRSLQNRIECLFVEKPLSFLIKKPALSVNVQDKYRLCVKSINYIKGVLLKEK